VAIILSLGFLVFVKSLPFEALSQDDANNLVVANKTKAFQITEANLVDDGFTLSLKNNDGRRITAFAITVGKEFRITEDFIISEVSDEVGIQPQETFKHTYPLSLSQRLLKITLQAVVFDDKTGDGDPVIFEDIRDARLGQAVQFKRTLKLLEKYEDSLNGEHGGDTSKLKQNIEAALNGPERETLTLLRDLHPLGTINRKGKDSLSDFVREGLAAGKADVLRRMKEVEDSANSRDSLLKMTAYYRKLLERI